MPRGFFVEIWGVFFGNRTTWIVSRGDLTAAMLSFDDFGKLRVSVCACANFT
jgi:hypothetical protein